MIRERIKWSLFPGLNLHARLRYKTLPRYFGRPANGEERLVLDAGCGNGMLAYQSCLLGNRVIGISVKEGEITRNKRLFNEFLGIPPQRLEFRLHNLYEVRKLGFAFDEIICTEVLEHIERDAEVCQSFFELLKPGGTLHLCCPNAEHPDNRSHELDEAEAGGHVRAGYTWESYAQLLEPIGFQITLRQGLGGPIRQACNKRITQAQRIVNRSCGLALFTALAWCPILDPAEPKTPLSLYLQAQKAEAAPCAV